MKNNFDINNIKLDDTIIVRPRTKGGKQKINKNGCCFKVDNINIKSNCILLKSEKTGYTRWCNVNHDECFFIISVNGQEE